MKSTNWAGFLLLILATTLYMMTLDNGLRPGELEGGDLITHQYAQVQARPSNAPGYPLYTMGGWLWFHALRPAIQWFGEPLPNPIPILSSYSTIWALLSLWLLYKILCQITRSRNRPNGNWLLAWLLSAFYATTYFFWYYATTTEQYSSAVAHTLGIVYLYLHWQQAIENEKAQTTPAQPFKSDAYLLALAFLSGLSLAHMLTVAFIVPPLVLILLWQSPPLLRRARLVIGSVIVAALPLLSYLYVYIRGAAHPEWWGEGEWTDAQAWFWAFLSTAQGRDELGWGFEPGRAFFGNGFPELIWHELSIPIVILGYIGILWVNRYLSQILYGTLILYAIFCWAYRYGNWFQVILPAYPLLLIGVAALADRVQLFFSERYRSLQTLKIRDKENSKSGKFVNARAIFATFLQFLPHMLLLIAIFWRFSASWPIANNRNQLDDTALTQAAILLDQPLPQKANLFSPVTETHALQYLIDIWQVRPDLRIANRFSAAQSLAQNETVLSTWDIAPRLLTELPSILNPSVQSATPDWALLQSPSNPQAIMPDITIGQAVMPGVQLQGYTIQEGPSGRPVLDATPIGLDVTLFWQIEASGWPEGVSISVRPMSRGAFIPNLAAGEGVIFQVDVPKPARGLLRLDPQFGTQSVTDAYRFALPEDTQTDVDSLMVILYQQTEDGFENLKELLLPIP